MHGGYEARVSCVDTAAKRIMKNKCVTEESIWLTALKSKSWCIYMYTTGQISALLLCCSGGWIGVTSAARGFLRADQNALGEPESSNPFSTLCSCFIKSTCCQMLINSGIGTEGCMCTKQVFCLVYTGTPRGGERQIGCLELILSIGNYNRSKITNQLPKDGEIYKEERKNIFRSSVSTVSAYQSM